MFPILPNKKDDPVQLITLDGKLGAGDDFHILAGEKKVGKINGKIIGGKFVITITNEDLQYDKTFHQLLILFCCALKYLDDVEDDIKTMVKNGKNNDLYEIDNYELKLFQNPRRMK